MAPRKRQVHDFFDLREGMDTLIAFARDVLGFLDAFGIGLGRTRAKGAAAAENGHVPLPANGVDATLRAKVKQHFHAQRGRPPKRPVGRPRKKPSLSSERIVANRQFSAAILGALNRTTPSPLIPGGDKNIAALVRRGYAKKKGDGYVLTAKKFVVNANHVPKALRVGEPAPEPSDGTSLTVAQAARRMKISESYARALVTRGKLPSRKETIGNKFRFALDPADVDAYAAEHLS